MIYKNMLNIIFAKQYQATNKSDVNNLFMQVSFLPFLYLVCVCGLLYIVPFLLLYMKKSYFTFRPFPLLNNMNVRYPVVLSHVRKANNMNTLFIFEKM